MSVFDKILRAGEGKKLRALQALVPDINALEPELEALSDAALQAKTGEFRTRLENGEDLDDLAVQAADDAMYWVTKMFEGQALFGKSYPALVGAIVALVTIMFVLHGLLAMRKFPANYHELRAFRGHQKMLRHEDTTLWWYIVSDIC